MSSVSANSHAHTLKEISSLQLALDKHSGHSSSSYQSLERPYEGGYSFWQEVGEKN